MYPSHTVRQSRTFPSQYVETFFYTLVFFTLSSSMEGESAVVAQQTASADESEVENVPESNSKKRKHIKILKTASEEKAFEETVGQFVQSSIQWEPKPSSVLTTRQMMEAFIQEGHSTASELLFFKEVRNQLKLKFPDSVYKKKGGIRGYDNISLKCAIIQSKTLSTNTISRSKASDKSSGQPASQGIIRSKSNAGVYVLKFDDQTNPTYYVGKSTDILKRLEQHSNGQGAACVAGRVFTRVPPVTDENMNDMECWERSEVLELMFRYGINAVRGWKFTLKTMPLEQKLSAFDDICERYDFCRRCGRGDHFVNECQALTTDRWTNGLDPRTMYHRYTSSYEHDTQIAAINADLEKEHQARLEAETKAEKEAQARLALERINAEAIRLLTTKPNDI